MSGATDYIGLITVEEGEAYDEQIFNSNAEQIDLQFQKLGYATGAYTPEFDGFTLQGTGKAVSGSYVRIGKLVIASFYMKAGTGAALGGAVITVTLPFKASSAVERTYYGRAGLHTPGIGGLVYPLDIVSNQGSSIAYLWASDPDARNALVSPGSIPYEWKKDDVIRGSLTYRTDDATV